MRRDGLMHAPGRSAVKGRRLAGIFVLCAAACLPGCVHRVPAVAPPVTVPKGFGPSGRAPLQTRWWTAFGDAALDRLVDAALRGNLGLRQAWDRLSQARAVAQKSRAGLYPTLDAEAGASGTLSRQGRSASLMIGLAASYEVDLWGRVRAGRDADRLALLASREDLQAAAITLVGEVATTWFQLVERREQLRLLEAQRAWSAQVLAVVTLKFNQGQGSAADVLQQRQVLEALTGEAAQVTAQERVLGHQLAVLTGRAPGAGAGPASARLPALPPIPRAGLPSKLLGRRPDVRGALRRVEAADQRVAAAVADRYPRLSLSASANVNGGYGPALFWGWLANLAANLVAPLVDGGARRAEVDRTRAVASEALHRYGQVVLDALKEVEDALAREAQQTRLVESLGRQLRLSATVVVEIRARYLQGAEEYLRVLDALLRHQALERSLLTARRDQLEQRVALYRALAGGWKLPAPETPRPAPRAVPTAQAATASRPGRSAP